MPPVVGSDTELIELIRDLATRSGVEERRFDRGSPIVNFQLPGGERVSAVMAVTTRPTVSIRRHRFAKVTLAELRENGTFDLALESFLKALVRAKRDVLVTGGTAIGKTTLLRGLASAIPPWERLITIEDVFELGLGEDADAHPDVVPLQAREPNIEGQGEISLSDLLWQSLRMSPDRVIVGEVRGPEVIPLTNAMSMGNDGSMGTLHTRSSQGAFTKLAVYAVRRNLRANRPRRPLPLPPNARYNEWLDIELRGRNDGQVRSRLVRLVAGPRSPSPARRGRDSCATRSTPASPRPFSRTHR